jgi:hypothetical protein
VTEGKAFVAVPLSLNLLVLFQRGCPDDICSLRVYKSHGPNTLTEFFRLQAADFLAIEGHVKDTCSALAARLFPEEEKNHSRRAKDDPAQVLLFKHATRFSCWLVIFQQGRPVPKCFQHVSTNLPTAVLFLLSATFPWALDACRQRLFQT